MAAPCPPPPPTPPPPPPPNGHGLTGAFDAASSVTPKRPMLLTPDALAAALPGGALVPTSGPSSSTQPPPAFPLAGLYINQHVPVVLSLNPPNFSQWRTLFEVTFQKSGMLGHISGPARPDDPTWLPDIFGLVHQRGATAAELWAAISSLFLENREHQAVFLATDFRRIEQGAGNVISYFARLKECADRLADLGEPVSDHEQVLNMFRGLHSRLRYAIPILTMHTPFPSFLRCRAFLLLEESRQQPEATHDTTLHAVRVSHTPNSGGVSGSGDTNHGGANGSGGNARCTGGNNHGGGGRNKGKGKVPDSSGSTNTGASRPPAAGTTPWTGMVHAWPMPWRSHAPGVGLLGPRPGGPSPFVGTAAHFGIPPPVPFPGAQPPAGPPVTWIAGGAPAHPLYGVAPSASTWDQGALIQALNNMGLQQAQASNPGSDWYLDTGASTHMASSSGSKDEAGDPPV